MRLERISVETRDHYQGAQEPVAFHWRGDRYEVEAIIDRWYEGYTDSTRMPLRYFKVKTKDGRMFTLRYHEFFTAWSILIPAEDAEI
ncbi:MAG: hypothetical protein RBS57_03685 [Desulforhabdus sp.]|jgi:hypothetical protein|nr:hypothetical protein [Desulforhabdus sp.]